MFVRVIQAFAIGDPVRVFRPGLYAMTPILAGELDELERMGWIVAHDGIPACELATPEGGRVLHARRVAPHTISGHGEIASSVLSGG